MANFGLSVSQLTGYEKIFSSGGDDDVDEGSGEFRGSNLTPRDQLAHFIGLAPSPDGASVASAAAGVVVVAVAGRFVCLADG